MKIKAMRNFNTRLLLSFVLTLVICSITTNQAKAGSCRTPALHQSYLNADIVFTGKIIDGIGGNRCGSKAMLFQTEKFYKGLPKEQIWVRSSDSCTGVGAGFKKGGEYVVFASISDNGPLQYQTYACSGTHQLEWIPQYGDPEFWDKLDKLNEAHQDIEDSREIPQENKSRLLAAHFLFWQDYQRAELALESLLESSPDEWVVESYLTSLYKQQKAQKIVQFDKQYKDKIKRKAGFGVSKYDSLVGYGYLVSGSPLPTKKEWRPNVQKDPLSFASEKITVTEPISLKDVKLQNLTIEGKRIDNFSMYDSGLQGVEFEQIKMGYARFYDVDFNNISFVDTDIEALHVSSGNLRSAVFQNMKLKELNISNTKISMARFDAMSAMKSRFSNTEITNVRFKETDLTGSEIKNSEIKSSDFSTANLTDISLEGTKFSCDTLWPEGFDPVAAGGVLNVKSCEDKIEKIQGQEFDGQDLRRESIGRNVSNSSFVGVNLEGKILSNISLKRNDFTDANLSKTKSYHKFSNLWLEQGTDYAGSTFKNTDFQGALLVFADFTNAKISNSNFELARYNCLTKWPEDFDPATNAAVLYNPLPGFRDDLGCIPQNYKAPDLSNVTLSDTDLSAINFLNVTLKGQDLSHSDVRRSDFSTANLENITIQGATFNCLTTWPEGFDPISAGAVLSNDSTNIDCKNRYGPMQLNGIDFSEKKLQMPEFTNANLRKANFTNSEIWRGDFFKADLSGAILNGADLSSSYLTEAKLDNVVYNCETKWPPGFDVSANGVNQLSQNCAK